MSKDKAREYTAEEILQMCALVGEFKVVSASDYNEVVKELADVKERTSREMVKLHQGRPSEWAYKILEQERDECKRIFELEQKWRLELEAKLAECVAALEFYADGGNWNTIDGQYALITGADLDGKHLHGGKLAREVLAKVKK